MAMLVLVTYGSMSRDGGADGRRRRGEVVRGACHVAVGCPRELWICRWACCGALMRSERGEGTKKRVGLLESSTRSRGAGLYETKKRVGLLESSTIIRGGRTV